MSRNSCKCCGRCGQQYKISQAPIFYGQDGWGAVPAKATFDNYNNNTKITGFYNNATVYAWYRINGIDYIGNKATYINGNYVLPSKYPGAVFVGCWACKCCSS